MSKTHDSPRMAVAAGLIAALVVVIAGLHWVGRFDLGGPPSWSADGVRDWANDPLLVVAAVARWIALGLAYYLAAVLLLLTVTGDAEKVGRVVPRTWIVPLAALVGIGVVAVTATGSRSGDAPIVSAPLTLQTSSAPLVLDPFEPEPMPESSISESFAPARGSVGPSAAANGEVAATTAPDDAVIVEPGDSFWALACESLIESWGRPVTDAEIAPYWRTIIEANLDRLVEPGNPDLILPGQELIVPSPPPDPVGT